MGNDGLRTTAVSLHSCHLYTTLRKLPLQDGMSAEGTTVLLMPPFMCLGFS